MIVDSRSIDNSCRLQSEICIVGAGAAGITLALEFLSKNISVFLLESGGARSDSMTQSLYAGKNAGLSYDRLEETRSRYLGGSTNCWGGWCRPLDFLDFEKRDWVPNSGWPFGKEEMYRHYVRSHSLLQLGPFNYDQDFWSPEFAKKNISLFPLDGRRIDNIVYQISPPSRFGSLYRAQLSQSSNVKVMLFANVAEIQTNESATEVTGVRVATLNGTNFTVSAKLVVLAAGGIENARLLLLSNQVQKMGLGNERGLVGRYFMDHPRIRWARVRLTDQLRHRQLYDATMAFTRSGYTYKDVRIAAHVAPTPEWQRKLSLPNSRTYLVAHYAHDMSDAYLCLKAIPRQLRGYRRFGYPIRDLAREIMRGLPALIANAPLAVIGALDFWFNPRLVKRDFDLETTLEPIPNYESRVSLSSTRDRLGLNQVTVDWRVTDQDRLHFNALRTLLTQELTRQDVVQLAGEPMDLAEIWPKTVVGCWHHMGTTRMDPDPAKGVVDADCRVHGISNLFVAGSSVFPSVGSDVPTITIVAMALRLAVRLEASLGV